MNRSIQFFFCALFCMIMTSCSDSPNNKLIQGNWQGVEWLANGHPSGKDASQASFSFDDKGVYSFVYADTKEEGTYKVENDMLFTTAKGANEIMVKITRLTKDSLVFDMNSGGQAETLTLLRK
jgi:hypothetical protein